jgi:hypothetical protein
MTELFEIMESMSQSQFIEIWETEERKNKHGPDGFTLNRIKELRAREALKCSVVRLTRIGFDCLVFSDAHQHGMMQIPAGETYPKVVQRYPAIRANSQGDKCFERLQEAIEYMDVEVSRAGNLWESQFVLGRVFQPGNPALPEHYQKCSGGRLCALNFHRFVAYGLWCQDHGYQPAKAYYFTCE